DSQPIGANEQAVLDSNHAIVAHRGREPGLQLTRDGKGVSLRNWALELLDEMRGICEMLDEGERDRPYIAALDVQSAKLYDVSLTPAARTLKELSDTGETFVDFALRMSKLHKSYFVDLYPPNEARLKEFAEIANSSLEKQADIERADSIGFDQYLAKYLASA
ncbi:MAG TPA: hypothetical protein VK629_16090, partial [Steroidobacteraceae bacterium]|nr:hypothetical protein [Steroidobacteraceae bacterium]